MVLLLANVWMLTHSNCHLLLPAHYLFSVLVWWSAGNVQETQAIFFSACSSFCRVHFVHLVLALPHMPLSLPHLGWQRWFWALAAPWTSLRLTHYPGPQTQSHICNKPGDKHKNRHTQKGMTTLNNSDTDAEKNEGKKQREERNSGDSLTGVKGGNQGYQARHSNWFSRGWKTKTSPENVHLHHHWIQRTHLWHLKTTECCHPLWSSDPYLVLTLLWATPGLRKGDSGSV